MKSTRIVAVFRWLAAATILSSVVWQVTDRMAHNLFRPAEYFAYFSIQGTLIAGVMLAYTGWLSWTGTPEKKQVTIARMSATTYSVVIAVVYNALLRDLPPVAADVGYDWPTAPNEMLHVWAPILLTIEWLVFTKHKALRWNAAFWAWAFPFAWLVFTIARGAVTGWWPYFFIDPTDEGGVPGMLTYIFGIMAFMFVVASLLLPAQLLSRRILNRG